MLHITISARTAAVLILAFVLVIPGTVLATHAFDDVPDSSVHSAGIEFVKDSGVSVGCGDGTNYCPSDPVSRAQMATFMHRLSGNAGSTPPSVNADSVDGYDASELLRVVWDEQNSLAVPGDILTKSIEVPRDGFLIVYGSLSARDVGTKWIQCHMQLDGTMIAGSDAQTAISDAGRQLCITSAATPVTQGTHTVTFWGNKWFGGDTDPQFWDSNMWALFVPFDGTP